MTIWIFRTRWVFLYKTYTKQTRFNKKVACTLELAQKIINLNKDSLFNVMFKIAEFFSTNLKVKEKNDQY